MDESSTLCEYQTQLEAVRQALEHAEGDQREELLDLKNKLEEVILLLQGDDVKPSTNTQESAQQKPSIDDEFALFQKEIQALECEQADEKTDTENHLEDRNGSGDTGNVGRQTEHELLQIVSSLEGTKCRAPFRQASGECTYHNALVVSANFDPSFITSIEDIQATVMFCNPVCEEMKPCEYFLNGSCRFSDSKCRYSHGHQVSVADLKEFLLPDLRNLNMDSKCLAKGKDGIWTKATVEKCLDDQKCFIKYDVSGETDTVELDCIIPLEENCKFDLSDDDDDSSLSQDIQLAGCDTSDYLGNSVSSNSLSFSSCPVAWEQHTKGIGSKLLEKMGHIWGQGLGKNSDGRLEPVEAVILPAGKSLDKCIEMREKCDTQGPISIETRMCMEQDKEEQRAKKAKAELKPVKRETVFDFINSRISAVKDDGRTLDLRKNSSLECQDQKPSNKSLNVQLFAVGEDISRVKRNLSRLQQSLQRNSNRNESTRAQIQRKITAESDTLRNLQQKESRLSKEIKTQNSQKKLTVF